MLDDQDRRDLLRLLQHVDMRDGCWLWTSTLSEQGYGRCWFRGKAVQAAHRVMYILLVGPLEPEDDLHHTCQVRACVNPKHLIPKNRPDHRHEHRVTECPKGHPYDEANTQWVSQGKGRMPKRRCKACQRAYMAEYHQRRKNRRH